VLNRSSFKSQKAVTLGILRHEMVHAEHYAAGAVDVSDPKARSGPIDVTSANTELLAYVEGFMTMFHLTDPAPTSDNAAAFVELLGALSTSKVFPWANANPLVRSEALGRLQQYYCHALDPSHQAAFDLWVSAKLARPPRAPITTGASSPGAPVPGEEDFYDSLHRVIAGKCRGVRTPMKL
jgi:hypothetical protein